MKVSHAFHEFSIIWITFHSSSRVLTPFVINFMILPPQLCIHIINKTVSNVIVHSIIESNKQIKKTALNLKMNLICNIEKTYLLATQLEI